jgi:hypothetical protein
LDKAKTKFIKGLVMKLTKLSLVAAFAVSGLYAGGEIAPAPAPVAPNATTVDGKGVFYYYTNDGVDLFDKANSAGVAAVTLNVSHTIMEGLTANFSALGYSDVGLSDSGFEYYFEGSESGAYFNVANLTATYADTTVILGRQLLATPMISGFDWLLAPSSFQAYTVMNKSIEGLTLVGSFIEKYRANNSGGTWADLTGDNWAVGAVYSSGFDVSVWYYSVDNGGDYGQNFGEVTDTAGVAYTQIYADAAYEISGVKLAAQYVMTDFDDAGEDSTTFGLKASTTFEGFDFVAAYTSITDRATVSIGVDTLYTTSWNTFASTMMSDAYKVSVSKEYNGITATVSYADFDAADDYNDDASELDVILGYSVTDNFSVNVVYTLTDTLSSNAVAADDSDDALGALEIYATYTF